MPTVEKDFSDLDVKYRGTISGAIGSDRRAADVVVARRSGSVLDVGCGDGVLLRYLFEQKDVPFDCLWGCDLDPKRVRNARRQLYAAWVGRNVKWKGVRGREGEPSGEDDLGVMRSLYNRIVCFDLLGDEEWPEAMRKEGIEVVTLLGVTPAFDDIQMSRVASKIADLGPDLVIDVSAYDDFPGNFGGRIGVERFFSLYGYRQTSAEWLPERFTVGSVRKLFHNRSYWPAAVLSVLERLG